MIGSDCHHTRNVFERINLNVAVSSSALCKFHQTGHELPTTAVVKTVPTETKTGGYQDREERTHHHKINRKTTSIFFLIQACFYLNYISFQQGDNSLE